MKKTILSVGILLATACSQGPDAIKLKTKNQGMPMPSFNMRMADTSQGFSSDNIHTGTTSFLMLFSPTCPYCRMQTRRITNNIKELKNIQFIFITEKEYIPELKAFKQEFQTDRINNLTIVVDTGHAFIDYFKPAQLPYTAIYDSEKKLIQEYFGAMSKKSILESIKI